MRVEKVWSLSDFAEQSSKNDLCDDPNIVADKKIELRLQELWTGIHGHSVSRNKSIGYNRQVPALKRLASPVRFCSLSLLTN